LAGGAAALGRSTSSSGRTPCPRRPSSTTRPRPARTPC
jgi:hypothetical protein